MQYKTEIVLRHTDPQALADDFEAVVQLIERRNAERRADPKTPNAAVRAAERIARGGV